MFPSTRTPSAAHDVPPSHRWLRALLALVVVFGQTGWIGHALFCPDHHGPDHHGQGQHPCAVAAGDVDDPAATGHAHPDGPGSGGGDRDDRDDPADDDDHDCPFTTPSLSTAAPAPHPGLIAIEACAAEAARIHAAGVHAPVERLRFAPKHSPPAA